MSTTPTSSAYTMKRQKEREKKKWDQDMWTWFVPACRSSRNLPGAPGKIERKSALDSEVLHTAWKKLFVMTIIFQFGDVLGDLEMIFGRFGGSLGGS